MARHHGERLRLMPDAIHHLHWYLSKARETPGIHRHLRDLRQDPALTRAAWRERAQGRLHFLLRFARVRVPFYRDRFARAGFNPDAPTWAEDFERVPVLTKRDVREHLADLLAEGVDRSRLIA